MVGRFFVWAVFVWTELCAKNRTWALAIPCPASVSACQSVNHPETPIGRQARSGAAPGRLGTMTILPGAVIVCPAGRFPFLDPNDYPPGIVRHWLCQEGGDGAHGLVGQRRRFSHEAIPLLPTHPQSPIPFRSRSPSKIRSIHTDRARIACSIRRFIRCPNIKYPVRFSCSRAQARESFRAGPTQHTQASALLFSSHQPKPLFHPMIEKIASKATRRRFQPLRHVVNVASKPVQRLGNNGSVCLGMACGSAEKIFRRFISYTPKPSWLE
jgi:hypothetical protein